MKPEREQAAMSALGASLDQTDAVLAELAEAMVEQKRLRQENAALAKRLGEAEGYLRTYVKVVPDKTVRSFLSSTPPQEQEKP